MSVNAAGLFGLIEPGISSARGRLSQPAWASGFGVVSLALMWGFSHSPLHSLLLSNVWVWGLVCFLSREEEDIAVLLTPEKPLRRGLSHRSDPNAVAPAPQGLRLSLGPLSPEKLEEIDQVCN